MKSSESEKKELIQAEEQPVKRKRGRPFGSKDSHKRYYTYSDEEILKRKQMTEKTYASGAISESDHEYNVKQINHIMKILEIAKQADVNDINTLRSCFMNYVKLCQEDGYKLGNIAAAASLGISYQTLNNWAKNVNRPEHKELAEVIKIACSMALQPRSFNV